MIIYLFTVKDPSKTILDAIVALLDCYFQAKTEEGFTELTSYNLKQSAKLLYAHLIMLYDLKQTLLFENEKKFPRMIKLHLLEHLTDAIVMFGALGKGNTDSYERNHKLATKAIWESTSKRNITVDMEMIKKSMLYDYNSKIRFLNSLQYYDFSKKNSVGDDEITFERITNIASCELYCYNDTDGYHFDSTDKLVAYNNLVHYLEYSNRQLKPSELNKMLIERIMNQERYTTMNKKSGVMNTLHYYTLTLLRGLKYCGNKESGIDAGYLYATSCYGAYERVR